MCSSDLRGLLDRAADAQLQVALLQQALIARIAFQPLAERGVGDGDHPLRALAQRAAAQVGGAVLGAAFVKATQYFMPAPWDFLASGLGLLVVLLALPGGLGAAFGRLRDELLRLRARRAGIRVPSLLADTLVTDENDDGAIPVADAVSAAVAGTAHAEDVTGVVD